MKDKKDGRVPSLSEAMGLEQKDKTVLEAACNFLGWQGGTVHQVRNELTEREGRLIRMYDWMDEETDEAVIRNVHVDLATVQYLLSLLPCEKS